MTTLMNTYGERALSLVRGEACRVWDDRGNAYFDALSGIAVCGLGHCHPAVTQALCEQAGTLVHASNLYHLPPQQQLADRLCALSGMEQAFFCNSGAEANEAALKLARRYGAARGVERPKVLVMDNSFHGRTLATLSATGNPKVKEGFAPLLEGFVTVAFDNPQAVSEAAAEHPDIVAVLVEPIQGEGGVRLPAPDYLNRLRELCDQHQWLLMLDEIQTGNGRTGRYFSYQHNEIEPDVVTTAKGLGNGVPIGVCLARGPAVDALTPGSHGSTFGGNPLACRTGMAVVDTIERERLSERAAELGERLLGHFRKQLADHPGVVDIRGQGLMLGIELERPCPELVARARERGLLINVTAGRVVRLLPPLIMTDEQADTLAHDVVELIRAF